MTAGDQQKANGHVEPKVRVLKLQDDVGFRTLPDQSVRRHFQHGFAFNILCIGETGIGKSTLMDSLFNFAFDLPTSSHDHPDVKIMSKSFELIENNVKLNVGIVETVGYGDQINKQSSCQAIIDYIDAKFEGYLQEELQISRKLSTFRDGRIHVCLYFITPTGHGLKALDLVCMKQLDSKVNLIPVIAKSDIISKQDLAAFKRRVQSELTNSGVQIYQFPVDDPMSPQDANRQYNSLMPFAVIGSRDLVRIGTKMVRARQYPWGVVQIENEAHCDFTRLRDAVLRYNLADLVESTHVKHYELYRRMRLIAMGFGDAGIGDSSTFERKWAEHRASLQKREDEVRETFVDKVSSSRATMPSFSEALRSYSAEVGSSTQHRCCDTQQKHHPYDDDTVSHIEYVGQDEGDDDDNDGDSAQGEANVKLQQHNNSSSNSIKSNNNNNSNNSCFHNNYTNVSNTNNDGDNNNDNSDRMINATSSNKDDVNSKNSSNNNCGSSSRSSSNNNTASKRTMTGDEASVSFYFEPTGDESLLWDHDADVWRGLNCSVVERFSLSALDGAVDDELVAHVGSTRERRTHSDPTQELDSRLQPCCPKTVCKTIAEGSFHAPPTSAAAAASVERWTKSPAFSCRGGERWVQRRRSVAVPSAAFCKEISRTVDPLEYSTVSEPSGRVKLLASKFDNSFH